MATTDRHCSWMRMKLILMLSLFAAAMLLNTIPCDAGSRSMQLMTGLRTSLAENRRELQSMEHFGELWPQDSSDSGPYGIAPPFSLPPLDSLAPVSLPQGQTTPPYCIYPPVPPSSPSPSIMSPPAPSFYVPPINPYLIPPLPPSGSSPPSSGPSSNPSPPETVPSPPSYVPGQPPNPPSFGPGYNPPSVEPSPPSNVPTPGGGDGSGGAPGTGGSGNGGSSGGTPGGGNGGSNGGGGSVPGSPVFVPSPPVFQPPIIFPPPAVPPPPHHGESLTLWCVAKPAVPDPIIQEAMNYACGSGADCDAIQLNGKCYQPDTLLSHASYAFNSYWQMTKVAGGTCDFGGTAILVTVDPSYDGCHFMNA